MNEMKKQETAHYVLRAMELKIMAANIAAANQGDRFIFGLWSHVAKEALLFEQVMRASLAENPTVPKKQRAPKANDLNPKVDTK